MDQEAQKAILELLKKIVETTKVRDNYIKRGKVLAAESAQEIIVLTRMELLKLL